MGPLRARSWNRRGTTRFKSVNTLNAFERFVFPSLMECLETSILGTNRRRLPVPHSPAKVYEFRRLFQCRCYSVRWRRAGRGGVGCSRWWSLSSPPEPCFVCVLALARSRRSELDALPRPHQTFQALALDDVFGPLTRPLSR